MAVANSNRKRWSVDENRDPSFACVATEGRLRSVDDVPRHSAIGVVHILIHVVLDVVLKRSGVPTFAQT